MKLLVNILNFLVNHLGIDGTNVSIDNVDVNLGSRVIRTDNVQLYEGQPGFITLKNKEGTEYASIIVFDLQFEEYLYCINPRGRISASNIDDTNIMGMAKKTGDALKEVNRWQGAEDPWFGLGENGNAARAYNSGKFEINGQEVSFGENDSGGVGFRQVLVPN